MGIIEMPEWIECLEYEEVLFIKDFFMAAGMVEAIAAQYELTESEIQAKVDAVREKVLENEQAGDDAFVALMKRLDRSGNINFETAKILISEYEYEKAQHVSEEQEDTKQSE